jgi:hypothetical protein
LWTVAHPVQIGLEGVAEAAVGVLVGGQGGQHRSPATPELDTVGTIPETQPQLATGSSMPPRITLVLID